MSMKLAPAALMLLAALVLVACAAPTTPAPTEVPPTEEPPAQEETEEVEATEQEAPSPVVLRLLVDQDPNRIGGLEDILAAFQQIDNGRWSHVSLEFEAVPFGDLLPKVSASVAAGVPYDIVEADGPLIKHYAFHGVILPLDEYFTEEEKQQWFPQSVEEGSYRGLFYAPPAMQSCSVMMYNTEMTDAAGISPPAALEDSWTMEEALDAWQKTTTDADGDGVPEVWGLQWGQSSRRSDYEHGIVRRSAGEPGSATFESVGPDGITFQGFLDTPEAAEAMQFYQDIYQVHRVSPVEVVRNLFQTGQAAFTVTAERTVGQLVAEYGEDGFPWDTTGIPYFETQLCHTGSIHWGISPNVQHFDEALAFLKFATSDEGARIWYERVRQIPANVNVVNELPVYQEDGRQRLWREAMERVGVPRIQSPAYLEYQTLIVEANTNIAQGADPLEQLGLVAQRVQSLASKYAGWNE